MAKAIFKFKNTRQVIEVTDPVKIKALKKRPKYILVSEEKPKRGRPVGSTNKPKEEQPSE